MQSSKRKRLIGLLLVFFVCMVSLSPPFQSFASFPQELRLFSGQGKQLQLTMPVNAQVTVKDTDIVKVNGNAKHSFQVNLKRTHLFAIRSLWANRDEAQSCSAAIPIKTVKVNVVPDLKVIPGGQTIGVKIKSAGILVVGHHLVTVAQDQKVSPGEEAKIQVGDLITKSTAKIPRMLVKLLIL